MWLGLGGLEPRALAPERYAERSGDAAFSIEPEFRTYRPAVVITVVEVNAILLDKDFVKLERGRRLAPRSLADQ